MSLKMSLYPQFHRFPTLLLSFVTLKRLQQLVLCLIEAGKQFQVLEANLEQCISSNVKAVTINQNDLFDQFLTSPQNCSIRA